MIRSLLVASAVLLAFPASAVDLAYKWKKGDVHRFAYENDTRISMGGMGGMGMGAAGDMKLHISSVFSEKILSVQPNGTANVELTLEKMDVKQGDQTIATIAQVPPAARSVKAELDRKGRAKFFRMVTLYMKEDQVYVGSVVSKGGTALHGSASAGGQQVELYAAVNPKTGAVTASATVKESAPKLKAVQVKEEDPSVDVLPRDILQMMELPEGDVQPGQSVSIGSMLGKVTFSMDALAGSVGTLHARMSGNEVKTSEKGMAVKKAEKRTDDAEEDDNAGAGNQGGMPGMGNMGGMPGMGNMGGMPGMGNMGGMGGTPGMGTGGQGSSGGGMATGMQMDLDVTSQFDVAAGRMIGMKGTAGQKMEMGEMGGGMGGMSISTKFTLQRQ